MSLASTRTHPARSSGAASVSDISTVPSAATFRRMPESSCTHVALGQFAWPVQPRRLDEAALSTKTHRRDVRVPGRKQVFSARLDKLACRCGCLQRVDGRPSPRHIGVAGLRRLPSFPETAVDRLSVKEPLVIPPSMCGHLPPTCGDLPMSKGFVGRRQSGYDRWAALAQPPYVESQARFRGFLDSIEGVWTEPTFFYDSSCYRFTDVSVVPKQHQKPMPPIRIAGSWPDAFR